VTALLASLLAIFAFGERSQAAETNIVTVSPADVGFGAIQVGQNSETRTIYVTNTGQTELQLQLDILDLLGLPTTDFEIVNPPLGNILTVAPGGVSTVQVRFSPDANGVQLAELGFTAVGSSVALQSVGLDGTGTDNDPLVQPGVQSDCTIVGTPRGERLTGTTGRDTICALGGPDKVNGQLASDKMRGGGGSDRIKDTAGRDKLYGQGGRDWLNARDAHRRDLLVGGAKRDTIIKDKGDRVRR
jgi:Ca2+-binding RTX toxin-like protein